MGREAAVRRVLLEGFEIGSGLIDGKFLFRPHGEVVDAVGHAVAPFHGRLDGLLNVFDIASEPLAERVRDFVLTQIVMHAAQAFVYEVCAIRPHGAAFQDYLLVEIEFMPLLLDADIPRP